MIDIPSVIEIIKSFGFPIAVCIWALWRLDKTLAKSELVPATLGDIEDGIAKIELGLNKNVEIQNEILITIKLLSQFISQKGDK
jgi:hypothetical protein